MLGLFFSFSFVFSFLSFLFAIIFARFQQGAPDCSGQRRIAVGSAGPNSEPQIAAGNAGAHPGGSGADWATPDLTRGGLKRTGQRRTSPGVSICQPRTSEEMPEDMSIEMSDNMSEKNVRMSKDMSEICQPRMSEDMSIETSDNMSEKKPKGRLEIYQKKCQ